MLVKKFKNCSDDIKVQLFRSQCTGMYTGQLWWNYSKCVIRKLIVAYNRAFRLLMGYPRDCSASGMFANNRLPSAQAILRNLCYKFIKRLEKSDNNLIHNIRNSDIWFHSNIRKHWLSILYMQIFSMYVQCVCVCVLSICLIMELKAKDMDHFLFYM